MLNKECINYCDKGIESKIFYNYKLGTMLKTNYYYDNESDRLLVVIERTTSIEGDKILSTYHIVYLYNDSNQLVQQIGYNIYSDTNEDIMITKRIYSYDIKGNCIKIIINNLDGTSYTEEMEYDSQNRLIKTTFVEEGTVIELHYNDTNIIKRCNINTNNNTEELTLYEYDSMNRLMYLTTDSGEIIINYVYDGTKLISELNVKRNVSTMYYYDTEDRLVKKIIK